MIPIINMAEKVIGTVFMCLQKLTGKLGPRFDTCNKSGKLTKTHIQFRNENVLRPSVSKHCSLLLDS